MYTQKINSLPSSISSISISISSSSTMIHDRKPSISQPSSSNSLHPDSGTSGQGRGHNRTASNSSIHSHGSSGGYRTDASENLLTDHSGRSVSSSPVPPAVHATSVQHTTSPPPPSRATRNLSHFPHLAAAMAPRRSSEPHGAPPSSPARPRGPIPGHQQMFRMDSDSTDSSRSRHSHSNSDQWGSGLPTSSAASSAPVRRDMRVHSSSSSERVPEGTQPPSSRRAPQIQIVGFGDGRTSSEDQSQRPRFPFGQRDASGRGRGSGSNGSSRRGF